MLDFRHHRIAELRAAHRARRLTVERLPNERCSCRLPGAIALDASAVASAMLTAIAPRHGRLP